MGLSSSQARLLSLTRRMHDIEYKAQNLAAQKLQMANQSAHVYREYEQALNATKIQVKTIGANGSASYIDATYNNMIERGYQIRFRDKVKVNQTIADNFTASSGNKDYFVYLQTGVSGAPSGYTPIYTVDQLKNIGTSGKYMLMADIDLGGAVWTPIGSSSSPFSGIFDGNGHTISNYTVNRAGNGIGLFGYTNNATITNIKIENATVESSGNYSGCLVGYAKNSTISNCDISGNLSGPAGLGGLVGYSNGCNISNSSANVTIKSTGVYNAATNQITTNSYSGGLVGYAGNNTNISNSTSSGNISGLNFCGGLVGSQSGGSITNSSSTADVDVESARAGGLVGASYQTTIDTSYASGNVSGPAQVGGLVGSNNGLIKNSYATGNAIGIDTEFQNNHDTSNLQDSIGGLVGGNWDSITNCYATGNVSGLNNVGGFLGFNANQASAVVSNSWASGSVSTSANDAGLFVGDAKPASSVNNCYVLSDTSGTQLNIYTDGNKRPEYVTTATQNELQTMANAGSAGPVLTTIGPSIIPPTVNNKNDSDEAKKAETLFSTIESNGFEIDNDESFINPAEGNEDNNNWFTNMLNEGFIYLFKQDANGEYYQTNLATDTNLQEVTNDIALKKAEAKYESDMRKIDAKDKKFDTDLAALEAERNAIKTEMETLKTVAKDNVDRTFKLFS